MNRTTFGAKLVLPACVVVAAAIGLGMGLMRQNGAHAASWIRTSQRLTLLSANDGQAHLKLNQQGQIDTENFTRDSVTVTHLGPDHPPVTETVYGTVPNTIRGAPYLVIVGGGRYGIVSGHGNGIFAPEQEKDVVSVIDLSSPGLPVVQKLHVLAPQMASLHPDGRHVIVACAAGFQVFEFRNGQLILKKDNKIGLTPSSMDISPDGSRIIAAVAGTPGADAAGVHVFRFRQGAVEPQSEVQVRAGLPRFDAPFALRFSPDGKRVLVPNGGGTPSKGRLDDVLSIDMNLDPPMVTEVIPQVADGIESLAFHPGGRMAVLACLDDAPWMAKSAYSHLAVVDLTSKPARLLSYVEVDPFPEGIEFTPDGRQLFVQATLANHIAVFDVDGLTLKRSPFVIRVGHGPSSMALGPRFIRRQ